MSEFAGFMNLLWSVLTVIANLAAIGLVVALSVPKFRTSAFVAFFARKGILVAFIVALLATIGSLVYSDVIGYKPCKLCWFQRIFMYPQVVFLGLALWRKAGQDAIIRLSSLWLSSIGAAIALYHYIGQLGWNPLALDCLAVGYSASCSKNFVLEFGYITIPMMAFAAFALMIVSVVAAGKRSE